MTSCVWSGGSLCVENRGRPEHRTLESGTVFRDRPTGCEDAGGDGDALESGRRKVVAGHYTERGLASKIVAETNHSDAADAFRLDLAGASRVEVELRRLGILDNGEEVLQVLVAGDSNMNVVRRVVTGRQSVVMKQSLPWVARYPQFAAPADRALREREFYELVAIEPLLARQMPQLYAVDPDLRLLVFEDLGPAADLTEYYQGMPISLRDLLVMVKFLAVLHERFRGLPEERRIRNREMRALNEPHLFQIPLAPDNGLDLDQREPGLAALAEPLKQNDALVRGVRNLGLQHYRTDGEALLHGDFFFGAMLSTPAGLRIIDAEFCFFGPAEFDVAVLLAHLLMARQPLAIIDGLMTQYSAGPGWRWELVAQMAGMEIIRRLLGYAQLPLPVGLEYKRRLLEVAVSLVLDGDPSICTQPGGKI